MNLVEQKKLTVMQKIMKKIYIMFANEKSIYSFPNLPVWLKNDEDVGKKLLEKCNHILSEEEILISESPVIAQLIDKEELRSIIVKRTDCYEYSALLPKEMQEELPGSVIINCPQDVILTFFSGNKEKEKKKIDFSKLDKETQFKIASIDNRYLKEMPKDTQLEYVGSNVLLRDILSEELQPEIFGENKDLKLFYGKSVDNISEEEYDTWKNYSNFRPYSIHKDVINKKSPKLLLELLKYGDKYYLRKI